MRWRANPFILFEGEQFPVLGGMFMFIFQIGKDPVLPTMQRASRQKNWIPCDDSSGSKFEATVDDVSNLTQRPPPIRDFFVSSSPSVLIMMCLDA